MTPSPETKGAQPEQLVKAQMMLDSGDWYSAVEWVAAARALATALSECRERERQMQDARAVIDATRYENGACSACGNRSVAHYCRPVSEAEALIRTILAAQPPSEASERSRNA